MCPGKRLRGVRMSFSEDWEAGTFPEHLERKLLHLFMHGRTAEGTVQTWRLDIAGLPQEITLSF